jgi:hypothetical protein
MSKIINSDIGQEWLAEVQAGHIRAAAKIEYDNFKIKTGIPAEDKEIFEECIANAKLQYEQYHNRTYKRKSS